MDELFLIFQFTFFIIAGFSARIWPDASPFSTLVYRYVAISVMKLKSCICNVQRLPMPIFIGKSCICNLQCATRCKFLTQIKSAKKLPRIFAMRCKFQNAKFWNITILHPLQLWVQKICNVFFAFASFLHSKFASKTCNAMQILDSSFLRSKFALTIFSFLFFEVKQSTTQIHLLDSSFNFMMQIFCACCNFMMKLFCALIFESATF